MTRSYCNQQTCNTHSHTHTHTHTRARAHTHTQKQTNKQTHTRTHTHSRINVGDTYAAATGKRVVPEERSTSTPAGPGMAVNESGTSTGASTMSTRR